MAEKVLKSFSEEEKKKITEIQSKVLSITSRLGEIQLAYLSFEESMKSLQEERLRQSPFNSSLSSSWSVSQFW